MYTDAQQLLAAFDSLPADERDAFVDELLRRRQVGAGELPDASLIEMAEELFLSYDREESADAASPR